MLPSYWFPKLSTYRYKVTWFLNYMKKKRLYKINSTTCLYFSYSDIKSHYTIFFEHHTIYIFSLHWHRNIFHSFDGRMNVLNLTKNTYPRRGRSSFQCTLNTSINLNLELTTHQQFKFRIKTDILMWQLKYSYQFWAKNHRTMCLKAGWWSWIY